jgi:hypothetical protein
MKFNFSFLLTTISLFSRSFVSSSIDVRCIDTLTSSVVEQIQSNNLVIDDNCGNNLQSNTKQQSSVIHDPRHEGLILSNNNVNTNGTLDDNGNHTNGTLDDNGNHQNGSIDDNGNHDNGTLTTICSNGADDKGNDLNCNNSACNVDVLNLCNKVRSEHNDFCSLMTDDECVNVVRNVSKTTLDFSQLNVGFHTYQLSILSLYTVLLVLIPFVLFY